jgi:hypothetical protein
MCFGRSTIAEFAIKRARIPSCYLQNIYSGCPDLITRRISRVFCVPSQHCKVADSRLPHLNRSRGPLSAQIAHEKTGFGRGGASAARAKARAIRACAGGFGW